METSTDTLLAIPAFLARKPGDVTHVIKGLQSYIALDTVMGSINAPVIKATPRSPKQWGWLIRDKIEDMIDEDKTSQIFNLLKDHKGKQGLLVFLQENFTAAKDELMGATDEYSEYFKGVSKEEIESRLKAYIGILTDIVAVQANKRASRKVRVKKKTAKNVSNVKFKLVDTDLKIESIDPAKIVGAKALLVFNTKYRRLAYFVATEDGFDISGTTLKNYDPDKSFAKTLKKPAQQLEQFRAANGVRRVVVLLRENINSKEFAVTGRLNPDMLLLKVF